MDNKILLKGKIKDMDDIIIDVDYWYINEIMIEYVDSRNNRNHVTHKNSLIADDE